MKNDTTHLFLVLWRKVRDMPEAQVSERTGIRMARMSALALRQAQEYGLPRHKQDSLLETVNFWVRVGNAIDTLTDPSENPLRVVIGPDGLPPNEGGAK